MHKLDQPLTPIVMLTNLMQGLIMKDFIAVFWLVTAYGCGRWQMYAYMTTS
jgi:hypothetical protein